MSVKYTALLGNSQRLDGGAMFGNAPKTMWSKWVDVDENNNIDLACRCLLIQEAALPEENKPARNILLETGVGAFFEPKMRTRYGIQEAGHMLVHNLKNVGLEPDDIDVIVLSHLHFDHAGGLLSEFKDGEEAELIFKNASIVTSHGAYERATHPHARDKASFVGIVIDSLKQAKRVELVKGETSALLGSKYRFHYSEGHTPGMLLTEFDYEGRPFVFGADLVPGEAWVHGSITMGYDRFPELIIDEKTALLEDLIARGGGLFFTHDAKVTGGYLGKNERGRFILTSKVNFT